MKVFPLTKANPCVSSKLRVFVDWDVESQGKLSNSRTAPRGIASSMSSRDGPLYRACAFPWVRRVADTFDSSELGGGSRESKTLERLRNGSGRQGQ